MIAGKSSIQIKVRALDPDGKVRAEGVLRPDVVADAVKIGGAPWHVLEMRGWRLDLGTQS